MVSGDGARIVRDFKRRNDRRTIVRIGEVKIEFVPVPLNGKDTFQLSLPLGAKIEHISLTEIEEKP